MTLLALPLGKLVNIQEYCVTQFETSALFVKKSNFFLDIRTCKIRRLGVLTNITKGLKA